MNPKPSRRIIITGSSSGIGRAVAEAFIDRGDRVVLHGTDRKKLAEVERELAAPGRTVAVVGDMRDKNTGPALVAAAVEKFGGLDVLVNNAGRFGARPFVDVSEEELDAFIDGNLKGTFRISQAAVRRMIADGGGAIVNIGTVLVDHALGGVPCAAPIASKGGIHALTVSLAGELARHRIRVNAVAPGMVKTPLHGNADESSLGGVALLRRVGHVREIADAVLYLADAEFTTGIIVNVDGGYVAGRA